VPASLPTEACPGVFDGDAVREWVVVGAYEDACVAGFHEPSQCLILAGVVGHHVPEPVPEFCLRQAAGGLLDDGEVSGMPAPESPGAVFLSSVPAVSWTPELSLDGWDEQCGELTGCRCFRPVESHIRIVSNFWTVRQSQKVIGQSTMR
jgi:hypothetical protein